jgi:hypothetical protein
MSNRFRWKRNDHDIEARSHGYFEIEIAEIAEITAGFEGSEFETLSFRRIEILDSGDEI